jgi:hypothetical protein
MGAVATLHYAIENYKDTYTREGRGIFSVNQPLRNSTVSNKTVNPSEELMVKAIVLDSPFHNFRDIAKEIALKKLAVPQFILDIALNYVEEAFSRILSEKIGEKYNPFGINFNKDIKLKIPIILVYS